MTATVTVIPVKGWMCGHEVLVGAIDRVTWGKLLPDVQLGHPSLLLSGAVQQAPATVPIAHDEAARPTAPVGRAAALA
jgi:hypothetical protein